MASIGDRYKDGGVGTHLYRWLRLERRGLRGLAAHFPVEGRIVDLGCGAGLLAHVLVEDAPGREVLGVDHDAFRVAALNVSAEGLPIAGVEADLADFEIPACQGIALVDVLHFLDAEAQERLLDRCVAALEPGGVLVVRDPDPDARLKFDLAKLQERASTGFGLSHARLGHYRRGPEWSFQLRLRGLQTRVLPLARLSPFADRTIVGIKR